MVDDVISPEGTHINSLIFMYDFDLLISDPIHILPSSSSSIDLSFTDKYNLVIVSGVHSSVHVNFHHQITYSNLNLIIVYPPDDCLVWDYRRANVSAINTTLYKSSGLRIFVFE